MFYTFEGETPIGFVEGTSVYLEGLSGRLCDLPNPVPL